MNRVLHAAVVAAVALTLALATATVARADGHYMKKGFFDPPAKGDQIYKADAGTQYAGDRKCLLCHIDYRNGKPPYKEWEWKDKYGLNNNGTFFRDSGYQRFMVPGTSGLASFLPTQTVPLKVKSHTEDGLTYGRASVEREDSSYKLQWAEFEKDGNPPNWAITPGYTYKEFKLKDVWMKYDPTTGRGDHWGKAEIKVETTVLVNGKQEKREIKFLGQFMGTNSGSDGRVLTGRIWTTGLDKDSYAPEFFDSTTYYDSTSFVKKTLKTFWGEYRMEATRPWVTESTTYGLIMTAGNKVAMTVSRATWSTEYRKRWDGVNLHKELTADTVKCAACHSTHRGQGDQLISRKTETMLCLLCHDGSGSAYNVNAGTIAGLHESPAGPMEKWVDASVASTTTKAAELRKGATSKHDVRYTTLLASAPGASPAFSGELRCSSCHDPHGNSNYRNLREAPNPYNTPADASRVTVKARLIRADGKIGSAETVDYQTGMTEFCSACHMDYQAGAGSGSTPYNGNPALAGKVAEPAMAGVRRHAMYVDGNDNTKYPLTGGEKLTVAGVTYPLKFESAQQVPEAFGGGKKDHPAGVACITCHFSHGTPLPNTNSELDVNGTKEWYDKAVGPSMMLRAPGRGVCQACHAKGQMSAP